MERILMRVVAGLAFVAGCTHRGILLPPGVPANDVQTETDAAHTPVYRERGRMFNAAGERLLTSIAIYEGDDGRVRKEVRILTEGEMRTEGEIKARLASGELSRDGALFSVDRKCLGSSLWLYTEYNQQGDRLCLKRGAGSVTVHDLLSFGYCYKLDSVLWLYVYCGEYWGEALRYGSFWGGDTCANVALITGSGNFNQTIKPWQKGNIWTPYIVNTASITSWSC